LLEKHSKFPATGECLSFGRDASRVSRLDLLQKDPGIFKNLFRNMKPFPIALILALCSGFFYPTGAHAQTSAPQDEHARLLTGKKRSLIAYAGTSHSFTLEIGAHTAKPSDIPGFITIDKQIVQSIVVPVAKSQDVDIRALTPAKEKAILLDYMNYELKYYRKKLNQHYAHLQTEWVPLHNRLFLVWYFDLPENDKVISRQVYASTLFYDQVMDLNAPVFKTDDWGRARGTLVRLAETMKTYDKPLDLEALRKKL
jgi:hypothetical protein